MAKKRPTNTGKITNRRAKFDYNLQDDYVAGIVLTGGETKSLRKGHGHLRGSYVTFKNNEPYLTNATITGDSSIIINEEDQTKARKLLLKKKEINQLLAAKNQGLTVVPIELLIKGKYIKLRISAGKGKKLYDKREVIKKRDQNRINNKELKNY
ncbi:MAG: SsrA-binding protein SmpB [Candidatus Saccharimonadales bacterium]